MNVTHLLTRWTQSLPRSYNMAAQMAFSKGELAAMTLDDPAELNVNKAERRAN